MSLDEMSSPHPEASDLSMYHDDGRMQAENALALLALYFAIVRAGRCTFPMGLLWRHGIAFVCSFPVHPLTNAVPTCFPIPIAIYPFDPSTMPTPPFYMLSFAIGGTPMTSFLGTDPNNLSWNVTHPVGSSLALSVVDAAGSPGGLSSNIVTVIGKLPACPIYCLLHSEIFEAGQSTDCTDSTQNTHDFTFLQIPTTLSTCDPWGLTMQGGHPPYSVTIVELNSPDFTNATLPADYDLFTYIDEGSPAGQLIDFSSRHCFSLKRRMILRTGRWATGTPVVDTAGGSDACGSLISSGGIASKTPTKEKHRNLIRVIAVSVPVIVLSLLGFGGGAWFISWRKRRLPRYRKTWPPVAIEPTQVFYDEDFEPATLYFPSPHWTNKTEPTSYTRLTHTTCPSLPSLPHFPSLSSLVYTDSQALTLTYDREIGDSWALVSPVLDYGNISFEEQQNQTPLVSQINPPARSKMPWAKPQRSRIVSTSSMDNLAGQSTCVVRSQPALLVVNVEEAHEGVAQTQQTGLFQWSFASNEVRYQDLTNTVPSCDSVPIVIIPMNSTTLGATPPFYMISFALGGIPVTSFIGTDPNNLTWTVVQPVGSQLAMSVVDANGRPGGLAADIISVVAGTTTDCVIGQSNSPPFTVSANVTGPSSLTTCEPWGLTMNGGVPPYTVTLVQPDSPAFTNVTLSDEDNVFTYINRAGPSDQLIAAVSDSTGRWASGTPIVNTVVNSDISCGGLANSASTSSDDALPAASSSAVSSSPSSNSTGPTQSEDSKSSGSRHTVVLAVSISIVIVAFLIALVTAAVFTRRRNRGFHPSLPRFAHRITLEPKSASSNRNAPHPSPPDLSDYEVPKPPTYPGLAHSANPSLSSLSNDAPVIALSYRPGQGNTWTAKPPATHFNHASFGSSSSADMLLNGTESSAKGRNNEKHTIASSLSVVNADEHSGDIYQHQDAGPARISIPPPYLSYNSRIWVVAILISSCLSQQVGLFQWGFGQNQVLTDEIPTCFPISIIIIPQNNTPPATPPFFMMSFPLGGTPVTSLIGSDPQNLSWTVTHPVNSQLALFVIDSKGNPGGVPPVLYNVLPGQTTDCVVNSTGSPSFSITANVTSPSAVKTCDPWGLAIHGGKAPYNVMLLQPGSPTYTNATVLPGFDLFTYINRGSPNNPLIDGRSLMYLTCLLSVHRCCQRFVSVGMILCCEVFIFANRTGQWATGTPVVNTTGGTDLTCNGLASSPGTSGGSNPPGQNNSHEKNHTLTIALSVALPVLALLILGAVALYARKRRRDNQIAIEVQPGWTIDPKTSPDRTDFDPASLYMPSPEGQTESHSYTRLTQYSTASASTLPGAAPAVALTYHHERGNDWTMKVPSTERNSTLTVMNHSQYPSTSALPDSLSGGALASPSGPSSARQSFVPSEKSRTGNGHRPPVSSVVDMDEESQLIQHQDAGLMMVGWETLPAENLPFPLTHLNSSHLGHVRMGSLNRILALYVLTLSFLILPSVSQEAGLFSWNLGHIDDDSDDPNTVPTCSPIPIVLTSSNSSAQPTPPFYMLSFPLGGMPVTTFLGSDLRNLTWTVTHPVKSRLALLVIDSKGDSGGVPSTLYTVDEGDRTHCIISPKSPSFTIAANVTSPSEINTCDPWGLTIRGGTPPYTVTILQPNSPTYTNATVASGFDAFTYINRGVPSSSLIETAPQITKLTSVLTTISLMTGAWAAGTPAVNTTGSADSTCSGIQNSSGTNTSGNSTSQQLGTGGKRRSLVIALSVVLVILALVVLGGAIFYAKKRKRWTTLHPPWARRIIDPKSSEPTEAHFAPATLHRHPSSGQTGQPYSYRRLTHQPESSGSGVPGVAPPVALSYHHERGNDWRMSTKGEPTGVHNLMQRHEDSSPSESLESHREGLPSKTSTVKKSVASFHEAETSKGSMLTDEQAPPVPPKTDRSPYVVNRHEDAASTRVGSPPPYTLQALSDEF
ncbi:LOW QUALITY PROTEIN: hypothetical protein CVT26_005132 [Gymnopilus dilepis]|uniref:Uncharacterized protein n=1 Tax=Gymnopilus dilepis TaxID=231916 RepID=A0A409YTH6_9AGAR|nr:LOW QUALITY PROTEIN: hypothetical protein CVT26_005132 [Gymnopilus dilepis]